MRERFVTVLVLALLFAAVAGAARLPVLEPSSPHGGADFGCHDGIAGRRSSSSVLGAVRAWAPTAVAPCATFARFDGVTRNRASVTRRSPRALLSARFHRKLAAPDGGPSEPPLVL
jgi:hypothetical protein